MHLNSSKFVVSKQFVYLLALAALVRIYFVLVTPFYWNGEQGSLQAFNDEPAHINYVKYLMKNHVLPVQTQNIQDEDALKTFEFEYYQPPLTYDIFSTAGSILGISPDSYNLVLTARFINLILGLLSIFYFYLLVNRLFQSHVAIILSYFYALSPVHIRHSSAFSNDVLLWLLLLILFHSILTDNWGGYKKIILEGLILGAALLTKSSGLVVVGVYLVLMAINYKNYQRWLTPVLIALLMASPYFIRNYSLYGEFLGISISHGAYTLGLSSLNPTLWFKFFRSLIISSSFPYDTVTIPLLLKAPAYIVWACIIFLSLILSLKNIWQKKNRLTTAIPEITWILSFTAMLVYNWNILMVEFRVIYFAFPMTLIILGDYVRLEHRKTLVAVILLAIIYPLLLVLIYG